MQGRTCVSVYQVSGLKANVSGVPADCDMTSAGEAATAAETARDRGG